MNKLIIAAVLVLAASTAQAQVATLVGAPIPDMEGVKRGDYSRWCTYSAPFKNTNALSYWKIPALMADGRVDCPLEIQIDGDSYTASRETLYNPHPDRPVAVEPPRPPLTAAQMQEAADEYSTPVCKYDGATKVCFKPAVQVAAEAKQCAEKKKIAPRTKCP